MSDIVEIRKAFGRADVKEVWLSVPTLLDEVDRLRAINAELLLALDRAEIILANMAKENKPEIAFRWQRWPISHEPLRSDARNLLPIISAAIAKAKGEAP